VTFLTCAVAHAQRVAVEGNAKSGALLAYSDSSSSGLVVMSGKRNKAGILQYVDTVTIFNAKTKRGVSLNFDRFGYPTRITGNDGSRILLKRLKNGSSYTASFQGKDGKQVGKTVRFQPIENAIPGLALMGTSDRAFQFPSLSQRLRSLPNELAGNPSVSELESVFGKGVGSGVSDILELGGDTIEKIITRVAKVGASIRSPIAAAKQIGDDFFDDVLSEMAETNETLQIALDVKSVIGLEPPDPSKIDRLSKYAKDIMGKLNSPTLPTYEPGGGSIDGPSILSASVFWPRPEGFTDEVWNQAAVTTMEVLRQQGATPNANANWSFDNRGILVNWNDILVPNGKDAEALWRRLYGNAPWQILSLDVKPQSS
jgi:hypothetical protein